MKLTPTIALPLVAVPVLASDSTDATHPLLQFAFGWLPVIIIIVVWLLFMRKMGGKKLGKQVDRSLEHMDRLEQQNQSILETLQRIEKHLRR